MSEGPIGVRPRLLLVGGGTGFVGRALVREFAADWSIRSIHRRPDPSERGAFREAVAADVATVEDWTPILRDVRVVVNLAWYRAGTDRRFRPLAEGLRRLVAAAEAAGIRRFVHVSVPPATPHLETTFPYLVRKREVDRALAASRLSYAIVRPTMLFGPQDRLLSVMLRIMARWHRFPMFGDGEYHVSPIAVADLARIVRQQAERDESTTALAGGPSRWRYRDLTDRLFAALGLSPRYFQLSPRGGERLAGLLAGLGSTLLYPYEVEWLTADLLGLAPYADPPVPLTPVENFLDAEGARLRPGARRG